MTYGSDLASVRAGDLLALFEKQIDPDLYHRLQSSWAASLRVDAQTLRSHGINVHYLPEGKQIALSLAASD